jgi:8-amino-7-oxononanoate synthase
LISGNSPIHDELEARLAEFHRAESALLFASGFQGNLAAVGSLVGKGDLVLLDRLAHASLVDAARLSGATLRVFPHNDAEALAEILTRNRTRNRILVLTESVFSMDGDPAPLRDLSSVCERHGALLLVDEAHATGVWGQGRGLCVEAGIQGSPHLLRTGTLSKALGGQGGYLLAPKVVRDLIINRGRAFIYSTGLAPVLCGAGLEALRILEAEPERRQRLWALTQKLRRILLPGGGTGAEDGGPIIPVILGSSESALRKARELWEAGFFVPAIRPPTVPKGKARLRVTLSALHSEPQIFALASALAL